MVRMNFLNEGRVIHSFPLTMPVSIPRYSAFQPVAVARRGTMLRRSTEGARADWNVLHGPI